ncbi:MAG: HD domain-containing protein [Candidatus Lokiarchaeota archaeon]|nr:HD domain-containing protein [Candidatus Lokiarchaeota archaeon]
MSFPKRLQKQLDFIMRIDDLKQIIRQTLLISDRRQENDAEHSWHLATMAILLQEYSNVEVDLLRVVQMVLIHDIIEIEAGDTFCYDKEGQIDKKAREIEAANKIFTKLPSDQAIHFRKLWDEFETTLTPEAKFAAALDRLQPLLQNFRTDGESWLKHGITRKQVIERNHHISEGSKLLWEYATWLIDESVNRGYLKD